MLACWLPPSAGGQSSIRPSALLRGRVVVARSGVALVGAQALAICCIDDGHPADTTSGLTGRDGSFVLDLPRLGKHFVMVRSLGYRAWRDTLMIDSPRDLGEIALSIDPLRLGYSPPADSVVARVRKLRALWRCSTDREAIELERQEWETLLRAAPKAFEFPDAPTDHELRRSLVASSDQSLCRRAARALDHVRLAASLEYVVFRFRDLILVSQPDHDAAIVFDRKFRVVAKFVPE